MYYSKSKTLNNPLSNHYACFIVCMCISKYTFVQGWFYFIWTYEDGLYNFMYSSNVATILRYFPMLPTTNDTNCVTNFKSPRRNHTIKKMFLNAERTIRRPNEINVLSNLLKLTHKLFYISMRINKITFASLPFD